MNRSVVALLALSITSVIGASCNAPDCGKGTVQKQDPDGSLHCVTVEPLDPSKCDLQTSILVGGICVSRLICDPATTKPVMTPDGKIVCLGVGGNDCNAQTPSGGANISVQGLILDWDTGMPLAAKARNVTVTAYDPLAFLGGMRTPLVSPTTTDAGCYHLDNIPNPGTGLVALAVDDPAGGADDLQLAGSGAVTAVGGKVYKVDLYAIKKTTVAGWKTQTGGAIDAAGAGVYLPCFYADDPPRNADMTLDAKEINQDKFARTPVAGVKLQLNGGAATGEKYLTDPLTVGATTVTAANGCAVIASPPLSLVSGSGGMCRGAPCNWQSLQGASTTGVLFITRFHTN